MTGITTSVLRPIKSHPHSPACVWLSVNALEMQNFFGELHAVDMPCPRNHDPKGFKMEGSKENALSLESCLGKWDFTVPCPPDFDFVSGQIRLFLSSPFPVFWRVVRFGNQGGKSGARLRQDWNEVQDQLARVSRLAFCRHAPAAAASIATKKSGKSDLLSQFLHTSESIRFVVVELFGKGRRRDGRSRENGKKVWDLGLHRRRS